MKDLNTRFSAPAPPQQTDPFDGVLLVDKPAGPTSHDIVAKIRRKFRFRKVGHGGTLDPQATGLLLILLGRGTKLSEQLMSCDKTYEGVIRLGVATDSQDAQGKVIREGDWSGITKENLEAAIARFTGDLYQTPPMVSAVKIDGVPLYKRARKGQVVEREARLIHVYEFTLRSFTPPMGDFILRCTKGVYVRTLCNDIGDMLGCGARLESLRRTESGSFKIDAATSMDRLMAMSADELKQIVIPIRQFAGRQAQERQCGQSQA